MYLANSLKIDYGHECLEADSYELQHNYQIQDQWVWARGDMIQVWIESHYEVLDPGEQVWIALSRTICI